MFAPGGQHFDPITLQRMAQILPEMQRRQRRVKKLRESQERLNEMAQTKIGGGVTRGSHGGLYEIQGRYIPDYAGMGEKLVGAVGGFMGDRKLDREEQELAEGLNPEILNTVQGIGAKDRPEGSPTDQTLRAYLGMLGGEDVKMKDILGEAGSGPRVHGTHKLANGNLGVIMSNSPDPIDTGVPFEVGVKYFQNKEGEQVPLATGASGVPGGVVGVEGTQGGVGTPGFAPPGQGPAPEGLVQVGQVSVDMSGMPPEAVEQVRSTLENLAAAGVAPEVLDAAAQSFAIKADRMRTDGAAAGQPVGPVNTAESEMGQTLGVPPPAPSPVAPPGGVPPATHPMAQESMVQTLGLPSPPPRLRTPTPGEIAYDRGRMGERGKIEERIAASDAIAQAAAAKETATRTATLTADAIATAKAALPKAQAMSRKVETEVNRIISDPATLAKISGASATGRLSATPFIGPELAKGYVGMFKGGSKEADQMATIENLSSQAFLQSYADALKGTGQISNIEGLKAAAANLQASLSQGPKRIAERLREFLAETKRLDERLARVANGQTASPDDAAARRKALIDKYRNP